MGLMNRTEESRWSHGAENLSCIRINVGGRTAPVIDRDGSIRRKGNSRAQQGLIRMSFRHNRLDFSQREHSRAWRYVNDGSVVPIAQFPLEGHDGARCAER